MAKKLNKELWMKVIDDFSIFILWSCGFCIFLASALFYIGHFYSVAQ